MGWIRNRLGRRPNERPAPKVRTGTAEGESAPAGTGAPAPVVYRRSPQYPDLYDFNVEKLDVNLLVRPDGDGYGETDAVLLLMFGCEELLGLDEMNEAYICRKLSDVLDGTHDAHGTSFEAVFRTTNVLDTQHVVDRCVNGGYIERLSDVAGGSLRLRDAARHRAAELAFDLNVRATKRR